MHQGWAVEADKLVVVTEPKFRSVAAPRRARSRLMNAIGKKTEQCFIVVNKVRDSRYEMLAADLRGQLQPRPGGGRHS